MKNIENKCMLITYADSMGKNLKTLAHILDKHFSGVFGGVHVLPFFPSSGDRGFAVINYDTVDPAFGSWEDIDHLAEKYYLMADFMLNHVSIRSQEFQDYQKKGDASPYRDMFIHWNEFWPGGEPTEKDLQALYMRKAQGPYIKLPSTIKTDGQKVRRYQLGCTYYSALDCDDDAYLLARAVQFFTPGIPQVYYVGLLAGENDMEALKNGGEGRSINRHNYTEEEIDQAVQKPMLQKLYRLMHFRNQHPDFDGNILVDQNSAGGRLHIQWKKDNAIAVLDADFGDRSFQITYTDVDSGSTKVLAL